jgi:RHS repeat-associated protein
MDGLGSVTDLTDPSQAVIEQYQYDAFGIMQTPPATGNIYTYTGREYDAETNLYYYRARYYNAQAGRFNISDPKKFKAGINFYVYVYNNPISLVDPRGLGPACGHSWNESWVKDAPGGFDFAEACYKHDSCCACNGDKSECAEKFLTDMLAVCFKYPNTLRDYCVDNAKSYYEVVKGRLGNCRKNEKDCCKSKK